MNICLDKLWNKCVGKTNNICDCLREYTLIIQQETVKDIDGIINGVCSNLLKDSNEMLSNKIPKNDFYLVNSWITKFRRELNQKLNEVNK